jgi:predicted LPLAT superfamily acyltransferase
VIGATGAGGWLPNSSYLQLSWKKGGRTISRILSGEQAALYRECVDSRRALEAVLDEMRDLSRQATEHLAAEHLAAEHLAAEAGVAFVGPSRPRDDRRRKR